MHRRYPGGPALRVIGSEGVRLGKEVGIEGRSGMDESELIDAVRNH